MRRQTGPRLDPEARKILMLLSSIGFPGEAARELAVIASRRRFTVQDIESMKASATGSQGVFTYIRRMITGDYQRNRFGGAV